MRRAARSQGLTVARVGPHEQLMRVRPTVLRRAGITAGDFVRVDVLGPGVILLTKVPTTAPTARER